LDADLKDFFGSADHAKVMELLNQRISDGRVLRLVEGMMTAGYAENGRTYRNERGVPQGGYLPYWAAFF